MSYLFIYSYRVLLLITVPFLTGVCMKRLKGREDFVKNNIPYYEDKLPYLVSIVVSIVMVTIMFYSLLILIDKLLPVSEYN